MQAKDFLSNRLFPLKRSDSIEIALEMMNGSNVGFLPVVEATRHLGYVAASDIMDVKPRTKKIADYINSQLVSKVNEDLHIFEVIRLFSEISSSTLSVVDARDQFRGIIDSKELISRMSEFSAFREPGSIITLMMAVTDYSLAEIARLVEYNNAKILSVHINNSGNERNINVHLKLNTNELKRIISTFQRYNYQVVASYFHEEDVNGLKNRYDLLMKYLDL